ncbi:MAG: aspartate aminotransferase family protein [Tepidisphaerales bacterium]
MATTAEIIERGKTVLIGNYARQPVVMQRGQGSLLWDADGRQYIDLFAGFGGSILGHCHPALVEAATRQAAKLWHVGNTFYTEPQVDLAERLNRTAFPGQAFFCHSGLEANEAACKLARLRGKDRGRWKIISLNKSFHGRSLAMISATGNPKTKAGFEPMVPGFIQVEPGDISALKSAIDKETAGILIEPIQGEGGINVYPAEYPAQVRRLCDEHGLTLIFDEVWTGCGRTGKWFGHQHFTDAAGRPVLPDIMTLGKAIGGGLPVGAMFARSEVARLLVPGTHGCTLGANPICMAVATAVFDAIESGKLLDQAARLGELAIARLSREPRLAGKIAGVRGRGFMLGIEMVTPPEKIVDKGLAKGIVINLTAQNVIRLAPPLNIPQDLWEKGLELVIDTLASA